MSTKFNMTRDINGYNGFGLMFAGDNYATTLATGVEQTLTVPDNYNNWLAVFSFEPGSTVYISRNATATVPGGSFALTTSQLIPTARQVQGGDVLHFITNDTTAAVGVSFYAL
jgi:hypothetical protein